MLMPTSAIHTSSPYSPWDQLPAPIPAETSYYTRHFYEHTAKHLIRDTVRIMMNGLHIDLDKVIELEATLDKQLELVSQRLAHNPLIQEFNKVQHKRNIKSYRMERKTKLREPSYYYKPFNPKDVTHRSFFMSLFAAKYNLPLPSEELMPGIPKWSSKLVRKLSSTRPVLVRMLEGHLTENHELVKQTVESVAKLKADLYNKSYLDQIKDPPIPVPEFNPGSSKQKQELFEWLGIPPIAFSKDTGLPSWGRDQIEEINQTTTDDNIRDFTQAFIDHSYAAIVRNNFIEAFFNYTVDSRLYGSIRLAGTKTFRPTSQNPFN